MDKILVENQLTLKTDKTELLFIANYTKSDTEIFFSR